MPAQLIALYSPTMGCGKTTAAKVLEEKHSYTPVKFATPIKRMLEPLLEDLGVPRAELPRWIEGDLKERRLEGLGVSVRRMAQTLGNEWAKEYIHEDLWVALAMRKVAPLLRAGQRVVVDDMRFLSEYDALASKGATMVMITRKDARETTKHASEGRLNDREFHHKINNDGSLDALYGMISKIVQ